MPDGHHSNRPRARRYVDAGDQDLGQRRPARGPLLAHRHRRSCGQSARQASLPWLIVALGDLRHQRRSRARGAGTCCSRRRTCTCRRADAVRLVSRRATSSTTSCRATSAATSSASATPPAAAQSKTLATTVILVDRGLGLMALVLVAALGATHGGQPAAAHGASPIWPSWLWAGFLCGAAVTAPAVFAPAGVRPAAAAADGRSPGMGRRPHRDAHRRARALPRAARRARRLLRRRASSCRRRWSSSTVAVAYALHLPVSPWDLAVIVPLSFVVQMLPVSVNGFGVREATFSLLLHAPRPADRIGGAAVARRHRRSRCSSR